MLAKLGMNRGVEVGTCEGKFAEILCKANPTLALTCVDPWERYPGHQGRSQDSQDLRYVAACRRLQPLNATILRKPSLTAAPEFPDASLDFVYIDGNHKFDFAISDIIFWAPKVRIGGIVALHDYCHEVGHDVVHAIDAYTQSHHIDPWYITRERVPTAFWVRKEAHDIHSVR